MKKILNKLKITKKNKVEEIPPLRITTDTVSHHREQILAGGRRFKYPLQYVKHKLVINAILISLVAIIFIAVFFWVQLYVSQNTSDFFYRVTKVLPLPVAYVDGQPVLYSDYLMKYRSSVNYLEQKEQVNFKTEDGKRRINYIKQQSMNDAVADAYAIKLSKKLGLSISNTELEIFFQSQRQLSDGEISKQTYDAITLDYYGWSPEEYRHMTEVKLLRQKVEYTLDKNGQIIANDIAAVLKNKADTDFKVIADGKYVDNIDVIEGKSGWVSKFNKDGGLALEAAKLNRLQVSSVIRSTIGDGYYIIRLLDSNSEQVNYEYVHIPLTTFDNMLNKIIKDKKVQKFISI